MPKIESLAAVSAKPPTANEKKLAAAYEKIGKLKGEVKELTTQRILLNKSLESSRKTTRPRFTSRKAGTRRKSDWVRVIVTDTHGAKIDKYAFSAVLSDIKELDPDEIVHLGDAVDCGGFLAAHHTLGFVAQTDYTYEQDIAAANAQLDALQAAAPRAKFHMLEGNHEQRVEKWAVTTALRSGKDGEFLRKLVSPHSLLHLEERGIRYYRESEKIDGGRVPGWLKLGKCWFVHGISTSKHAASAHLQKAGGNVVYGHTHRIDSAYTDGPEIGQIGAWNPGCLCELQPLWRHTSPTTWGQGYGVQMVNRSGEFMHFNVPILNGKSLLMPLFRK